MFLLPCMTCKHCVWECVSVSLPRYEHKVACVCTCAYTCLHTLSIIDRYVCMYLLTMQWRLCVCTWCLVSRSEKECVCVVYT